MSLTTTPVSSPWSVADIFRDASFRERRQMVLDLITAYPERHNQMIWAVADGQLLAGSICGTVACIAGWACILNGDELFSPDGDWDFDFVRPADGAPVLEVGERAAELLGLTEDQADRLFLDMDEGAIAQLRELAA